jgi:hypothetical protein
VHIGEKQQINHITMDRQKIKATKPHKNLKIMQPFSLKIYTLASHQDIG